MPKGIGPRTKLLTLLAFLDFPRLPTSPFVTPAVLLHYLTNHN